MTKQTMTKQTMTKQTFVLLHGAHHGGWCWGPTAALLRAAGHVVTTPTLGGLGERCHQLGPEITLDSMTEDLANHILWEELTDVTLVGHSFGGLIITSVADRIPAPLKGLVYLDALWLEGGECIFDTMPADVAAAREAAAMAHDGGLSLPAPPPEAYGIVETDQQAWLRRRVTPQPLSTYRNKLHLKAPPTNGLPAHYVVCSAPRYELLIPHAERAAAAGLTLHDMAGPHDVMVSHPSETAEMLLRCAEAMG